MSWKPSNQLLQLFTTCETLAECYLCFMKFSMEICLKQEMELKKMDHPYVVGYRDFFISYEKEVRTIDYLLLSVL